MKEECVICGAPLQYLETDEMMECAICHKKEKNKTRCTQGHYVCNECHMKGMDAIIGLCLKEESKNPIEILSNLMDQPFCHMHGPEHHVMVGSSLLTAYKNAGGDTVNARFCIFSMRKKYAIFNISDDNLCTFVYDHLNQSYGGDERYGKRNRYLTDQMYAGGPRPESPL